ncbi:39S ribosomal protein L4, mitochondrial isoform X1 [Equus quagga]|uniref:39S ribosomal protein L4, mitochondrial isoform X1 n=1 Tax=Equus quagga TaxID=89248 RepID=UPI001EE30361|nr:39S ribosomal protein L4, mitochondrial isoform X1 [Equus quagga]
MGSGAAMLLLCRAGARAWLRSPGCRGLSALAEEAVKPAEKSQPVASGGPQEPVLRRCELPVVAPRRPVQAWVESLRGYEQERVGLTELHPDVFAAAPRLDILHQVAIWQKNFKRISYAKTKTRAEVRGGGRKPWPQKGSGRARHGSIRSPIWRGGGIAHGPRGPTSYYYMLPMKVRVQGLKVALSVKLAQRARGHAPQHRGCHLRPQDLQPGASDRPQRAQHAEAPDPGPHPAHRGLPGGQAALARLTLHGPVPLPPALPRLPLSRGQQRPAPPAPWEAPSSPGEAEATHRVAELVSPREGVIRQRARPISWPSPPFFGFKSNCIL